MTPFKVTKPAEQLAILGGIRTKKGPSPAQDWGYVFDRNGDGKVDYLCYFMGPMPVEGADFPADFPKREADGKLRLKKEEIEFLVRHMKAVFYHVADDDFDGRADGVVIFSMDPDRNWVNGWGLFRSTKGDGDLDDARRFRFDITKPTGSPERVEGGWAWMGLHGERKTVSPTVLEGWSAIFGRINVAVAAFELKPGSLPRE
jgi:hypothetical protein